MAGQLTDTTQMVSVLGGAGSYLRATGDALTSQQMGFASFMVSILKADNTQLHTPWWLGSEQVCDCERTSDDIFHVFDVTRTYVNFLTRPSFCIHTDTDTQ